MTTSAPARFILPGIAAALCACTPRPVPRAADPHPDPAPSSTATAPSPLPTSEPLPDDRDAPAIERIARAIPRLCPPAPDSDTAARDLAASRLTRLDALLNTCDERVLWCIHDPAAPFDPLESTSIELEPLAWAKLYLSLFTFPAAASKTTTDDDYTILTLPAHFRSALPPGDYPHPIWQSADDWDAYAATSSLHLVFLNDRFFAAFIPPAPGAPAPTAAKPPPWTGQWHWTNAAGAPQPRTAEFAYLFSTDNPHTPALSDAYSKLQPSLRAQGCLACHSPDNKSNATVLFLLGFANQSLAVRHSLPAILRENRMPPGDLRHGKLPGIQDAGARQEFIRLADDFSTHADAALLFESDRRGVARRPPPPPRPKPPY
jgi:hypothetical protein